MSKRRLSIVMVVNGIIWLLCGLAGPWGESPELAAVTATAALPFHVVLAIVAWRVHRQGAATWAEVETGQAAVRALSGGGAAPVGSRLLDAAINYVKLRRTAHEDFQIDGLHARLRDAIEECLQPLHRQERFAQMVGLAGTAAGIALQVRVAQLGEFFLVGVLVKAGTLLAGIIVAGFAGALCQEIEKASKEHAAVVEHFMARNMSPLSPAEITTGDPDAVFHELVRALEAAADKLTAEAKTALNVAATRAEASLRKFVVEDLAPVIREMAEPLRRNEEKVHETVRDGLKNLQIAATVLNDAARTFTASQNQILQTVERLPVLVEQASNAAAAAARNLSNLQTASREAMVPVHSLVGEAQRVVKDSRDGRDGQAEMARFLAEVTRAATEIHKAAGALEKELAARNGGNGRGGAA